MNLVGRPPYVNSLVTGLPVVKMVLLAQVALSKMDSTWGCRSKFHNNRDTGVGSGSTLGILRLKKDIITPQIDNAGPVGKFGNNVGS